MNKILKVSLLLAGFWLVQGCATQAVDREAHFNLNPLLGSQGSEAIENNTKTGQADGEVSKRDSVPTSGKLSAEPGPKTPVRSGTLQGQKLEALSQLDGEPINLAVNNLPLPVFINRVFGEKLELSYSLSPALSDQTDLVTLRLTESLAPADLFRTARSVLADYGVAITQREGVWHFSLSEDVSTEGTPLLVTGEALPDVPVSHRPVFQVIELSVVRNNQVRALVQSLFKGQKLQVSEDAMRNAIMLKGPADQVADAANAVEFFDQPLLKGRNSLLLRPVYRDIDPLSTALEEVLSAQGYALGTPGGSSGSIILLPMPEMEVIVAFANDRQTLNQVQRWAEQLDRSYQQNIDSGMFLYEVQNTSAANLANLVSQLYGGESPTTGQSAGGNTDNERRQGSNTDATNGNSRSGRTGHSTEVAEGRLVVDEQRNVLIFRGSGRTWIELRDIIQKLDKQVPSVLMEVLLAEVTLNDRQGFGVEWFAKNGIDDLDGTLSTLGGLGIGGNGFTYTLNKAGQTRAVLNAFYDSNQAVIRSSPKIMVKSGETARIEVGNEIPILTSTREGEFQTGGSTDVLQQFQFRQTGVNLSVQPVVQASGLVDIVINQTLSETQDSGSGANFLPTILNRSVETSLTLRDGGSVVLGGLISETSSEGQQGVPLLGRIPVLGRLFRTEADNTSTTELLVMVVPYVIRDNAQAERVSEQLRQRVQGLESSPEKEDN